MDSGGKGPAPWLCQGPKRESRQGTKRPEPEGGTVEGGAAPRSLQVWGRAGLPEKMGDTEETLQTPRKGCGQPLSAAQERDGGHQCMDGVWSSRTPGPGQLQRPLAWRFVILPLTTGGLCHLSCKGLTGVAGGSRECAAHRPHLPEGVGPVLCFLICMLRSVGGNHSVPPAPGAQSWCPQAPGPAGLEGPLEHVRHILLVVWAALPGLHVSTLCSESSTPLGMARPPPRPQSLPPTPAHPLLADQVLDISPLLLSSHPASAPTQVQSADFFKKGNLKSGLHFCVKWPDF